MQTYKLLIGLDQPVTANLWCGKKIDKTEIPTKERNKNKG